MPESLNTPGVEIPPDLQNTVAITTLDRVYNWSRRNSCWPMMFGLACCAFEMICAAASRYDIARYGMEVMRPSPRQADFMLVSGTVTKKMVPQIVRLYNQIAEPRCVVAMGACACGGGPFKEGYSVVPGIDKFIPVDVFIPGCPPTPQALLNGLMTLQKLLDGQTLKNASWYSREPSRVYPIPVLGPDLMDSGRYELIKAADKQKAELLAAAQSTADATPTEGQEEV